MPRTSASFVSACAISMSAAVCLSPHVPGGGAFLWATIVSVAMRPSASVVTSSASVAGASPGAPIPTMAFRSASRAAALSGVDCAGVAIAASGLSFASAAYRAAADTTAATFGRAMPGSESARTIWSDENARLGPMSAMIRTSASTANRPAAPHPVFFVRSPFTFAANALCNAR